MRCRAKKCIPSGGNYKLFECFRLFFPKHSNLGNLRILSDDLIELFEKSLNRRGIKDRRKDHLLLINLCKLGCPGKIKLNATACNIETKMNIALWRRHTLEFPLKILHNRIGNRNKELFSTFEDASFKGHGVVEKLKRDVPALLL